MDDRLEKVVAGLLMQEGEQIVRDMAGHVGDEIHAVLKRHGMMMRTTGGAVSVGVLAAIQILAESIEFARRSMDGDPDDEAMIVGATAHLFVTEAQSALPDLRLAGVKEGLEMAGEDDATLDRVYEAIVRAGCPSREGPYGGYDYGYNEDFYGPAPKEGRYVVRDYRAPNSPTWGKPVHYSHDREEHEAAFHRLTGRHIAQAAIRAIPVKADDREKA